MSDQIEITKNIIQYLNEKSYRKNIIINKLINETKKLGNVSNMQISPEQGQFLELLVKITKSKKCLEIGRFTGLSSLFIARGLPKGGKLITIDNSLEFLSIAEKYWRASKVIHKIQPVKSQGLHALYKYIEKKLFFDFIFIDADKNNYIKYYNLSLKLLKSNGIIVLDNMLWGGRITNKM